VIWFLAALVVVVMGGVAALAAGRGAPLSDAYDDRPDALVPADRALRGDDVRRVRFSLAFRGYRMSEVDALLDRVARQLDGTDADDELAVGTPPEALAEPTPPAPERPSRRAAPRHAARPGEVINTPPAADARGDDHTT